jgi:hypothetical protein
MPTWRECGPAYGGQQIRNGHRAAAACYDPAVEQPVAADSAARLQN